MWTEGERRGALLVAALLVMGTLHDAWRSARPPAPAPPAASGRGAEAIAEPLSAPAAGAPDSGAAAARLDLNSADAHALDALPGIGPVLAERILRERRRLGGFRSAEELLSVPGIGPRLYERISPRVRVGERR